MNKIVLILALLISVPCYAENQVDYRSLDMELNMVKQLGNQIVISEENRRLSSENQQLRNQLIILENQVRELQSKVNQPQLTSKQRKFLSGPNQQTNAAINTVNTMQNRMNTQMILSSPNVVPVFVIPY